MKPSTNTAETQANVLGQIAGKLHKKRVFNYTALLSKYLPDCFTLDLI